MRWSWLHLSTSRRERYGAEQSALTRDEDNLAARVTGLDGLVRTDGFVERDALADHHRDLPLIDEGGGLVETLRGDRSTERARRCRVVALESVEGRDRHHAPAGSDRLEAPVPGVATDAV